MPLKASKAIGHGDPITLLVSGIPIMGFITRVQGRAGQHGILPEARPTPELPILSTRGDREDLSVGHIAHGGGVVTTARAVIRVSGRVVPTYQACRLKTLTRVVGVRDFEVF